MKTLLKYLAAGCVAVAAVSIFAMPTQAALLMEDSFDYTLGQSIVGQNGGTGWAGNAWTQRSTIGPASGTIINGLTLGALVVDGNAVQLTQTGRNEASGQGVTIYDREIGTAPSTAGTASTLWTSFLYQLNTDQSSQTHQFKDHDDNELFHQMESDSNTKFGVHNTNQDTAASPLATDTTYLFVSRYTNVNSGSTNAQGTLWVLTASQFDDLAAGGISDAEMDALTASDYTFKLTAPQNGANQDLDFVVGEDVGMLISVIGGANTTQYTFDELRFATTAEAALPIPEPASLALLGLGVLLMLPRRRA